MPLGVRPYADANEQWVVHGYHPLPVAERAGMAILLGEGAGGATVVLGGLLFVGHYLAPFFCLSLNAVWQNPRKRRGLKSRPFLSQ